MSDQEYRLRRARDMQLAAEWDASQARVQYEAGAYGAALRSQGLQKLCALMARAWMRIDEESP